MSGSREPGRLVLKDQLRRHPVLGLLFRVRFRSRDRSLFFFLLIRHPPSPPLFPYPPLSRSQERPPVLQVADLVHRRDAWVLELGGNPGLVGEPAGGCRAGGVPVPENLDRHVPVEGEVARSEEHTSELQSQSNLGCRLLLVKK